MIGMRMVEADQLQPARVGVPFGDPVLIGPDQVSSPAFLGADVRERQYLVDLAGGPAEHRAAHFVGITLRTIATDRSSSVRAQRERVGLRVFALRELRALRVFLSPKRLGEIAVSTVGEHRYDHAAR